MAMLERSIAQPLPRGAAPARDIPAAGEAGRRSRQLTWLIAAIILTAVTSIIAVFQTTSATATGYEVRELERQRQDAQARNYQRESDIAALIALDRVEWEARRLGLEPRQQAVYLDVPLPAPEGTHIPQRFAPNWAPGPERPESAWRRFLTRLLTP